MAARACRPALTLAVEVTVCGEIDPATGMVVDLARLKALMWSAALDHLDHRNIDRDVAEFAAVPSTAENIAVYIWRRLAGCLPQLHAVRVHETEHNIAEYRGE